MKDFGGKAVFLDRSDINTDEIIPAKYLNEISKEDLKPYLLEDLELDGFEKETVLDKKAGAVITRKNFGCGSSREHAPWALEVNGINIVIAESFARIFRQNMFNCGMMAVELPEKEISRIFEFAGAESAFVNVNFEYRKIKVSGDGGEYETSFEISEFDDKLVRAGGWINYADENY